MGEQVAARLKKKIPKGMIFGGRSSVGRAPALQAGGQEFESLSLHDGNEQCGQTHLHLSIVQMHVMK